MAGKAEEMVWGYWLRDPGDRRQGAQGTARAHRRVTPLTPRVVAAPTADPMIALQIAADPRSIGRALRPIVPMAATVVWFGALLSVLFGVWPVIGAMALVLLPLLVLGRLDAAAADTARRHD